jgi:FkbM family methyltransferase
MKKTILRFAAWMARLLPMPLKRALYRFQPLARLVRGTLNRAAPQGLTQVKVAAGELAGVKLYLDLQTEKDYWLGTYEPELQDAVAHWVQPGMVIYDVGANIGYVSLILALRTGAAGRVFSFEALPGNLERLRANVDLSGVAEQVQVVAAAVIDGQRPVRFWVGPSGGMGKAEGSAGRQDVAYSGAIDVSGLSLDHFVYELGNPPPQVVKIDIEGGEVLALPGMQHLLAEAHPILLMELHGPEAAKTTWELLNQAGYRICQMQPGYPVIPSLDALDWKAYIVAL